MSSSIFRSACLMTYHDTSVHHHNMLHYLLYWKLTAQFLMEIAVLALGLVGTILDVGVNSSQVLAQPSCLLK